MTFPNPVSVNLGNLKNNCRSDFDGKMKLKFHSERIDTTKVLNIWSKITFWHWNLFLITSVAIIFYVVKTEISRDFNKHREK